MTISIGRILYQIIYIFEKSRLILYSSATETVTPSCLNLSKIILPPSRKAEGAETLARFLPASLPSQSWPQWLGAVVLGKCGSSA